LRLPKPSPAGSC